MKTRARFVVDARPPCLFFSLFSPECVASTHLFYGVEFLAALPWETLYTWACCRGALCQSTPYVDNGGTHPSI